GRVACPGGMVRLRTVLDLISAARTAISSSVPKLMPFGAVAKVLSVGVLEWQEPQRRSTIPLTTVNGTRSSDGAGPVPGMDTTASTTSAAASGAPADIHAAAAVGRRSN